MKKLITALTALLTLTVTASAMSYTQAREQALFLTDKMAYELNLTEEQYDAAYEVNLDYLMSINTYDDLYGDYWRQRNMDLSYIFLDWQYRAFCAASYFYKPLYWTSGVWHFAIYSRYPRRNYFYFGRPSIYITYKGGHGWRHNGGRSWYKGRTFNHGNIGKGHGMRERFDRGDFRKDNDKRFDRGNNRGNNSSFGKNNGRGNRGTISSGGRKDDKDNNKNRPSTSVPSRGTVSGNKTFYRGTRESSTRTTARPSTSINSKDVKYRGTGTSNRTVSTPSRSTTRSTPRNTFTPRSTSTSSSVSRSTTSRPSSSGSSRGGSSSRNSSSGSGGNGGGHFGGRR